MSQSAFGFSGESALWDAVHVEFKLFEDTEIAQAIDPHPQGEYRAYLAGKAAALAEFRQHLLDLRRQAKG